MTKEENLNFSAVKGILVSLLQKWVCYNVELVVSGSNTDFDSHLPPSKSAIAKSVHSLTSAFLVFHSWDEKSNAYFISF